MEPRAVTHGTKRRNQLVTRIEIRRFFGNLFKGIVILVTIFGVMFYFQSGHYYSLLETIIAALLTGCAIGVVIPYKKALFICIFNYIIYPLSFTLMVISLGTYLLSLLGVVYIPSIYLLLFLGIFAPCIALIPLVRRRNDSEYLKKARAAIDILLVFVGMCGFAAIYALHNTDYSFLITEFDFNLQEMEKKGLQGRDLFNNIVLGTTFPLLMTSNLPNAYLNNRIDKLNTHTNE